MLKAASLRLCKLALPALWIAMAAPAQSTMESVSIAPGALQLRNVDAHAVTYRGRAATQITDIAPATVGDAGRLATVRGSSLEDGTIDVDLAGDTKPDADPTARGFVGIAFRVGSDASHFECFYLRPKNGRASDQLQRNHSTQYISVPGFPWQKLRSETPGMYESYVDLAPGEWTHVRIATTGKTARLFVGGATQPVLVVNDLKQPVGGGAVALWVGPGTIAHFSNLSIRGQPDVSG